MYKHININNTCTKIFSKFIICKVEVWFVLIILLYIFKKSHVWPSSILLLKRLYIERRLEKRFASYLSFIHSRFTAVSFPAKNSFTRHFESLLCCEKRLCYFVSRVTSIFHREIPARSRPRKLRHRCWKWVKLKTPCFFHNGRVSVPLLRTTLLTRRFSAVTRGDRRGIERTRGGWGVGGGGLAGGGILSCNAGWLMRRRGLRSHGWHEFSNSKAR